MCRLSILLFALMMGCSDPVPPSADLVIDGVSILDLESGAWSPDRALYVSEGKITAILDAGSGIPAGAAVVDGDGKYVIPGLWDAHVHSVTNRDWHFPLMLAHGVTAVRNMHTSEPDPLGMIEQIREEGRSGVIPPIRFIANGALVDGESSWPGAVVITDPARAAGLVDSLVAGGADFLKIYDSVSRPVFEALVEAAQARGLPVDGHLPFAVPMQAAAEAGMRTVEHLSGVVQGCSSEAEAVAADHARSLEGPPLPFPAGDSLYLSLVRRLSDTEDPALCDEVRRTYVASGMAATPTLINGVSLGDPAGAMQSGQALDLLPGALRTQWEMMAGPGPGQMLSAIMRPVVEKTPAQVQSLHEAGVPILVGTDAGNLFVVPGISVHQELGLLTEAGLSPLESIRAATRTPAEIFGLADSLGLVQPGFVADLVILNDDPLANITAIRSISSVVLRGQLYDRAELDSLLASVSDR